MIVNRGEGILDRAREIFWLLNAIKEAMYLIGDQNLREVNIQAGPYQLHLYQAILIDNVVLAVLQWMIQWISRGGAALGLWKFGMQLEEGKKVEVILSAGVIV